MSDRALRRRLTVDKRRAELIAACLRLIGTRPWDDVTMAEVADEAGVSKPLLYHYFATKRELYRATVRSAADELRAVSEPDPALPYSERLRPALEAHLDWIERNEIAYRAILQGGISSDADVQAIVDESRHDTVKRLADEFGIATPTAAQHVALRGWVG